MNFDFKTQLVILLLGAATVYFLPSVVAFKRRSPDRVMILLLDAFLGWTGIVWIVVMIWAFRDNRAQSTS